MADPNIPFGSNQSFPSKTAPFSRDIIEWLQQQLVGPPGPKGDKGDTGLTGATGATGANAPEIVAEYSANGSSWHTTYNASADIYIHFSTDGGATFGDAITIVGEKGDDGDPAPNVMIQYSSDGLAYYNTIQNPTNYIRFSLDGGSIWQTGIYVKGDNGTNGTNAYNVIIQYSVDGNSYHTTYVVGVDKYIRFSVDNGSNWLVSDRFIGTDGTNGTNGTNSYLYMAWADDDQGNGFTMTFDPTKAYIAFYQSTTSITPNQTTFTGLWKNIEGIAGTAGTNAYVYVAWASDNTGTGFSLSPAIGLDYIAVKSTSVYIETPQANDFSGLWKYVKGDTGQGSYYIELPYQATLHGRCIDVSVVKPTGWILDSGDKISNPLSTNPIDLVIYHNTGLEVVEVVVKSITADRQTLLIGPVAYSTFEDNTAKTYLSIKSFSETATTLGIFIKFHE